MHLALCQAQEALRLDYVTVGAVCVHKDKIISAAHNGQKRKTRCQETEEFIPEVLQHAELLAVITATQVLHAKYLQDCQLYVSLEPCPFCAAALYHLRLGALFFGAYDPKGGGLVHNAPSNFLAKFQKTTQIIGGVLETDSATLLQYFFQHKRKNLHI
jgi:tRNA(Arg) A34 adenosine deaminase TadA